MGVQIFCLISCAPPIKLGQLTYPIKRDNPDVNIKIWPFFFFFFLFLLSGCSFWFLFFSFSLCGWYLKCSSSSSLCPSYRHILTTSSSSSVHLLLLVFGKEIFWIFLLPNVLRVWCESKVWRETKWLVYGDNGVWFLFHYETCKKKNIFGWCKGCSQKIIGVAGILYFTCLLKFLNEWLGREAPPLKLSCIYILL